MLTADVIESILAPIFEDENHDYTEEWGIVIEWMDPHTPSKELPPSNVKRAAQAIMADHVLRHNLFANYENAVRHHFTQNIRQLLSSTTGDFSYHCKIISSAHRHYASSLQLIGFGPHDLQQFTRTFGALVWNEVDKESFQRGIQSYLSKQPPSGAVDSKDSTISSLISCGLAEQVHILLAVWFTQEIYLFIRNTCANVWDQPILGDMKQWAGGQLLHNLQTVIALPDSSASRINAEALKICEETFARLRIEEIYHMTIALPSSEIGLGELKACLKTPKQRAAAVSSFQRSCNKILLQGGVQTTDIIKVYVSALRAFMLIDPRGILLEKAIRPLRRYLKERDDTISCLVAGMLGNANSELAFLFAELKSRTIGPSLTTDLDDPNWVPDPIDAPSNFKRNSYSSDIIGSLLSLYDNKDIFIHEFTSVFADRMIRDPQCLDEIESFIQLLKERFGTRELQNLEVMFRDMTDSIILNGAVRRQSNDIPLFLNPRVVSKLYWPKFPQDTFRPPNRLVAAMSNFSTAYSREKKGREVKFLPSVGPMTVNLDFKDRVRQFVVSPLEASVIMLFEDGQPWTVMQIAQTLDVKEPLARSLCHFWVSKRAIHAVNKDQSLFQALEHLDQAANVSADVLPDDDAATSNDIAATIQATEEMQAYWHFIKNMLTSLDRMPSEKIHSFLKMLVPKETPYTKTKDELENYLLLKVEEGVLQFSNGEFRLKK